MTRRRFRFPTLSARLRITGWILLTTAVALVAVSTTARSISQLEIAQSANEAVTQETQEFVRFAETGSNPRTGGPFETVADLLRQYIHRQSLTTGESLVAIVDDTVVSAEGASTASVEAGTPVSALSPPLREVANASATSGITATSDGALHWARIEVTFGAQNATLVITQATDQAVASLQRSTLAMAWVGLAGLVLTCGIAWLVAGQILKPIRQVQRVAQDISTKDLSGRVPVNGNDDIAAVATTFNLMLDRLQAIHDTQQRFVDDAGHELRTPITIVRGHLELLSEDPAERAATLRLVDSELARMGRIVSDLLVLARSEQPNFVNPAEVELTELMLDIEAKVQVLGDRRWQLVQIAEGEQVLDAQRITQAFLQLATNAVQYTQPGDKIRMGSSLEVDDCGQILRFWIHDSGPGVSQADAAHIFERFERGDGHRSGTSPHERAGAGLGLAIVRAIAHAHGGSAWVSSTKGDGARFGIDLPAEFPDRSESSGEEPATTIPLHVLPSA
ncbi:ATP-binding protein [Glutamicibacter endophyticus]|uniref:sensor histidine kinase n=1 Tax=Glutamicibacter endophyticus TaxID=1522174 RepID=UPI003AF18090